MNVCNTQKKKSILHLSSWTSLSRWKTKQLIEFLSKIEFHIFSSLRFVQSALRSSHQISMIFKIYFRYKKRKTQNYCTYDNSYRCGLIETLYKELYQKMTGTIWKNSGTIFRNLISEENFWGGGGWGGEYLAGCFIPFYLFVFFLLK